MATREEIKANVVKLIEAGAPEADIDAYVSLVKKDLSRGVTGSWEEEPTEPGLLQKTGSDVVKRGKQFGKAFMQPISPTNMLRQAGAVAGLVGDIGGNIGGALYSQLVPQEAQDIIGSGVGYVAGSKPVQYAFGKAQEFEEKNPETGQSIRDIANILTVVPVGKVASTGASKIAMATAKSEANLNKAMRGVVKRDYPKAVRPTYVGKSNAPAMNKAIDNQTAAVKSIITRNVDNVVPETLEQFSNSISKTKKQVFDEYHKMAVDAGENGAMVDIVPVKKEFLDILNANNIPEAYKDSAKEVLRQMDSFDDLVEPSKIEDLIATFNTKTKSFWANKNPYAATEAVMFERANNTIRKQLDDAIDAYSGPGYQELKNEYGALKSIEKEVADRTQVDLRKNEKGFFNLADAPKLGTFALGLHNLDPGLLLSSAAMHLGQKYIQHLNDPNTYVKRMFRDVGKLVDKKNKLYPPSNISLTGNKAKKATKQTGKMDDVVDDSYIRETTGIGSLPTNKLQLTEAEKPTLGELLSGRIRMVPYKPTKNPTEFFGDDPLSMIQEKIYKRPKDIPSDDEIMELIKKNKKKQ
jgi:hypothetical protein